MSKPRAARVSFGVITALLTTLVVSMAGPAPAAAAPVPCSPYGYLFQTPTPAASTVSTVDIVTGEVTPVGETADSVNAVGYNRLDEYFYGYDLRTGDLVQIGADYDLTPLGWTPPWDELPSFLNLGDVDDQGHLWLMHNVSQKWAEVDVNSGSPTFGEVLQFGQGQPLPETVYGSDWSWIDGALYSVGRMSSSEAVLLKFDPQTLETETLGSLGFPVPVGVGATYADAAGYLYAVENQGRIYRVDVDAVTAVNYSRTQPASLNDGARCADASIDIDLGDAPQSYRTSLADDGPRHSLPADVGTTHRSPLMLGALVDGENDGLPGATALGDDENDIADEDAAANPVVLTAGAPSSIAGRATNDTDTVATLAGWLDLNRNGTFDPSERVIQSVPPRSVDIEVVLDWPTAPADDSYLRLRLFPGTVDDPSPTGPALAGEVEDHPVDVLVPRLSVTKTSPDLATARIGDPVHYTVTMTNTGDGDYTVSDPAHVVDDLSEVLDDATYNGDADAPNGTVTYAEPQIRWTGPLAAGAQVSLDYTVTLTGAGDRSVRNTAFQVGCDPENAGCDPVVPDTCEDGIDPVTGQACAILGRDFGRLVSTKTASAATATDGTVITYEVTIENTGAAAYGQPVSVVDDLSRVLDDATYNNDATVSAGSVVYSEPTLTWNGTLDVGARVTLRYSVTVDTSRGGDRMLRNVVVNQDPADPAGGVPADGGPACGAEPSDNGRLCRVDVAVTGVAGAEAASTLPLLPSTGSSGAAPTVAAGAALLLLGTFLVVGAHLRRRRA